MEKRAENAPGLNEPQVKSPGPAASKANSRDSNYPCVAVPPLDRQEALDILNRYGYQIDTLDMPPFPHRRFSRTIRSSISALPTVLLATKRTASASLIRAAVLWHSIKKAARRRWWGALR